MIENFWATPIYTSKLPEEIRINTLNWVLSNFDLDNTPPAHEIPGIISKDDGTLTSFLTYMKEEFTKFTNIKDDNLKVHSWLTGSCNSYFHYPHTHRSGEVSGVVYLLAEEGGDLLLSDPRHQCGRGFPGAYNNIFNLKPKVRFTPSSGDIILFPSFLEHMVPPYTGRSRRIAIPVDFFGVKSGEQETEDDGFNYPFSIF